MILILFLYRFLDCGLLLCGRGGEAMDGYVPEEVRKCEEFLDNKMKPSLLRATAERNKLFEQQKIFSDLRKNIENLQKNSITNLRTMVNIGSEVYMQAEVDDTQRIFVDIGYGFHVEFTWDEALNYIPQREELLARRIEECTHRIVRIKADIKRVHEAIRQLVQIPQEPYVEERVF